MNKYTEKDQLFIEELIVDTFNEIDKVYNNSLQKEKTDVVVSGSRLIFPKYSSANQTNPDKLRVSEQELRFTFVELFSKKCEQQKADYHYSIETPTEMKYVFSEKVFSGKYLPRKADGEDKGKSARFDLTIYDSNLNAICHIEFKNNDSNYNNYEKDFLKLSTEGTGLLCYFIDLIESSDSGTLKNGIKPRLQKVNSEYFSNVKYIAHCLNNRGKVEKKGFDTIYKGDILDGKPQEWKPLPLD